MTVLQRVFFVQVWNGSAWVRDSDATFGAPALAYARCAELVEGGVEIDDVCVGAAEEEITIARAS